MLLDQETLRFIFGLKLRGLRLDRELSLKELSKKTGLSPSYLNEIEKGKKYPKSDKIMVLAEALGESYDDLTSIRLKKELQLVTQLLEKNVFTGMPFDIFGIPAATIFELIAERPKKMGALVGTLLEIARAHNVKVDDFFFATLRAYLDMHQNYFPSIEEKVDAFKADFEFELPLDAGLAFEKIKLILEHDFELNIREVDFRTLPKELSTLSYFVKVASGRPVVHIHAGLNLKEKVMILARELGFQYLRLKTRPSTSLVANLDSFDQLFNHFSASYFASSLLIPRAEICAELEAFFKLSKWAPESFQQIITKYSLPVDSVFHRITQVLPKFFGLDHIFLLRFDQPTGAPQPQMVRELHLSALHSPHSVFGDEHYCARWITSRLIKESLPNEVVVGTQRSKFLFSTNEYLNISAAYHGNFDGERVCVTLGLLLNNKAKEVVKFSVGPEIPAKTVSETCERCELSDCSERLAPLRADLDPQRFDKIKCAIESV